MECRFRKYFFSGMLGLFVGWFTPYLYAAPPITIFIAKNIITLDSMQPTATAVAVKDHRIYSVGTLDQMKSWMRPGTYAINYTFQNAVIVPGFIEPHSHWTMLAIFTAHPYVGFWDFPGLNGTMLKAIKSKSAVIDYLKAEDKKITDPSAVLFAFGYDPIYFNNSSLTAADLDQVSTTRPIFVLNANGHIGYINSLLLSKVGYNSDTQIKGVLKDPTGKPNGILEEAEAMSPVLYSIYSQLFTPDSFSQGLYGMAETAHRLGLTTVSDLFFGGPGEKMMIEQMHKAANDVNYPVRTVVVSNGMLLSEMEQKDEGRGIAYLTNLMQANEENLRFNGVKFISDGSIQGFTARLKWPGYFNGAPNGLFDMTTEQLKTAALPFWKAGIPLHVHVNGDEATDSALDVLEYLQNQAPRKSNIFVLEHDQLSSPEQFTRTHRLGAYVDLFPNHIYYWGDQDYSITLGPDRANRLDSVNEAKKHDIIYALHTDSPVTPLGSLHSMWAAMNRMTASGRVLGADQRISAEDALRGVTLNAAYVLNLQNEIGSIAIGKKADFTVLARDPYLEPAKTIKDIPVVATIQNGHVFLISNQDTNEKK
jgi:predicted amidohydrolase YtcJ